MNAPEMPAASRREVVIGTSDFGAAGEECMERASAAAVEEHLGGMREVLLRGTLGAPPPPEGLPLAAVAIRADDTRRLDELHDALDQVCYWALEEGTTYAATPSLLAQAEAPEVVFVCLASGRPRIAVSALRAAAHMARHPQCLSELQRVARGYRALRAESAEAAGQPAREGGEHRSAALLQAVAAALQGSTGRADVCVAAADAATALLVQDRAAVPDALEAGVVAAALSALQRHAGGGGGEVRVAVLRLLAVLVGEFGEWGGEEHQASEGGADSGGDGEAEPPLSVLLCDVGVARDYVMPAVEADWDSLEVRRWALRFLRSCARDPRNAVPLLQCHAHRACLRALRESTYTPDVFAVAAEAVGLLTPALDAWQTRGLLYVVRDGLLARDDASSQAVLLALLYAALRRHTGGGAGQAARVNPYSLYKMPPGCEPPASTLRETRGKREGCAPRLEVSEKLDVGGGGPAGWQHFFMRLRLPQVVGHVLDFYSGVLRDDELGVDDVREALRMRTLAEECFRMLIS